MEIAIVVLLLIVVMLVLATFFFKGDRRGEDPALNLLQNQINASTQQTAQQVETLQIDIFLKARRLDDAVRACRGEAAVAEINVAYKLIEAERWADAQKLLSGICPGLRGQSAEGNCLQLLEYAKSRQQ